MWLPWKSRTADQALAEEDDAVPWPRTFRWLRRWMTGSQMWPWLSAVLLVALILVPLGLFIWLLLGTDTFTVQAVTVVDARPHTVAAARPIVQDVLTDTFLGQTIFFIDTELIESKLLQALPQVRTAHVQRVLPGTLKVILQEKEPALLFVSTGRYYLVDEQGMPYEEARLDTLPGVVLPTVKNEDTAHTITLGVPVATADVVSFIRYLETHLAERVGAEIVELRMPSLSAREIHVKLANNWEIFFDVTRPAPEQLDTLERVLGEIVTTEERETLEYIDLRIRGRVYYKTRDEV